MRGVTLRDIINAEDKKLRPAEAFGFFAESASILSHRRHRDILRRNDDPLFKKYPNMALSNIEVAATRAQALSQIGSDFAEREVLPYVKGLPREMWKRSIQALKETEEYRRIILNTLFDSSSTEFSELWPIVEPYLRDRDNTLFVPVLHQMGFGQIKHIYEIYRRAEGHVRKGGDSDHYQLICEAIADYVQHMPIGYSVLTKDDLPLVYEEKNHSNVVKEAPNFESIGKTIGIIFSRASKREYNIDPQKVSLFGFFEPQTLQVVFDASRPQKFDVVVVYDNEVDDPLSLSFAFDTKEKFFDWPFIESSDAMPDIYKNVRLMIDSVLQDVLRQAEEHYLARRNKFSAQPDRGDVVVQEQSFRPEVIPARPVGSKRKNLNREQQVPLDDLESQSITTSLRRIIIIEDALKPQLLSLSSVDRKTVEEAIVEFNIKQIGGFKRLHSTNPEGEHYYSLRVNTTVPGGVRILLEQESLGNGLQKLKIKAVGYRKDIYKKQGI